MSVLPVHLISCSVTFNWSHHSQQAQTFVFCVLFCVLYAGWFFEKKSLSSLLIHVLMISLSNLKGYAQAKIIKKIGDFILAY